MSFKNFINLLYVGICKSLCMYLYSYLRLFTKAKWNFLYRMAQRPQNYGSTDQRVDVPEIGFSPTELYSLCENITTNIYTINASWKILERAYKNIGTSKDNQALRDKV